MDTNAEHTPAEAKEIVILPEHRDKHGRFLPGVSKHGDWTPSEVEAYAKAGGVAKATKRELMAQKADERILKRANFVDPSIETADDAWGELAADAYVASKAVFEGQGDLRQGAMAAKLALEIAGRSAERGANAGQQTLVLVQLSDGQRAQVEAIEGKYAENG